MKRIQAVSYLREHPSLWDESDRVIVHALKSAGIVAPGTYYRDCNVSRLVRTAQAQARPTERRCPTCGHAFST